jgi:hypothetical protein
MLNSIAVPSHRLRLTVLAVVLAMCLGLSGVALVSGASAEPSGGSGSGSAGQGCTLAGGTQMDDGETQKYRTGNRHGSVTCSNGTICREDGTTNPDGSTTWTSACKDADGTVWVVREPSPVQTLTLAPPLR